MRRVTGALHLVHDDDAYLARAVNSAHQPHFDIGGPAGTGDDDHGAGLRGRIRHAREQFVNIRKYFIPFDNRNVPGREQRNQSRFPRLGQKYERAGVGERKIGRGNPEFMARARIA